MKNSKRLTSAALCAIMSTALLSGCGGGKEGSSGDLTTVSVWTQNSHSQQVITDLCNKWNETTGKEKGIKIDYQVKGGDTLAQSIELALQNGTAPDFFTTGDIHKLAPTGDILPIAELPNGEEILKKYDGMLSEFFGMDNGVAYQVPVTATTTGLVYNKEMFKAAGIVDENGEAKPPETLEEMREVAKKLTNPEKKEYGIIYQIKDVGVYGDLITATAKASTGDLGYSPATGEYDFSGYKPVMEAIMGMKEDGSIYPGAEGIDNDTARALFAEGGIGMKMAFSFDVGVFNDQFPAKIDWGVAPRPVADKDNAYMQFMDYGSSPFIYAKSKVPKEKLEEVFKFFISDEYIRECYKQGTDLPYDWDIVKDIELDDTAKKGWKEFAELVSISEGHPPTIWGDFTGLRECKTIFLDDVYTGKMSIDDAIALMNENSNKAVKQQLELNPDKDMSSYYIDGWTPTKRN